MDAPPIPTASRPGELDEPDATRAEDPDFEALYHEAPCGYLTTDEAGTILQVNDTFLTWTGHHREDLLGTRLPKLLPIGDQILWSTHCLPQLSVVGAVAEMAVEVIGADRTRRSALISATRRVGGPDRRTEDRVVVFSAHERMAYERNLVEALRRAEDSEAREATAEAHLRHLTHHDGVTGLPNRAHLVERLDLALAERRTPGTVLSLLRIDLDHFTAVNDSLGHAAGDELLTLVAQRLRSEVRDTSTVAGISGDEFAVVAEVPDADAGLRLAQRLLRGIEVPATIEDLELVTSASVGLVVAGDGDTSERLLRRADVAVRQGKAKGGGCCEIHDRVDPGGAVDRLRLLGELRKGIERDELRLHHQPRVDLATGALSGVEALVRWDHPTRGLLPPSEFVDTAEASGLILPLGAWVLDAALAQVARWATEDPDAGAIEMAVNLSTRQLADPELVDLVVAALARHGVAPGQLTLEITETALMGDADHAMEALAALKSIGVGLAVDDFGTGYSSLTYLKRFPIDELKIDRSFVAGLDRDRGDAAIVTSCVQLAHALGIRAVAEGVETEEQRRALVDLGCDLAQGYLFARPLTADDLVAWRRQRAEGA